MLTDALTDNQNIAHSTIPIISSLTTAAWGNDSNSDSRNVPKIIANSAHSTFTQSLQLTIQAVLFIGAQIAQVSWSIWIALAGQVRHLWQQ